MAETWVTVVCDCYPGGFSPDTFEGPMEYCPVHGEAKEVLIQQRDEARAENARLRALVAEAIDAGASNTPGEVARIRAEAGLDGAV